MHRSTKFYPHSLGLSACFRQWRASSHCNQLHGYALAFLYEFESISLDHRNWVMDFGAMKPVKEWLQHTFDHRLIVASDDPELETFEALNVKGIADVVIMPATGCEAFAETAFAFCRTYIERVGAYPRVRLSRVTCYEHDANSASYSE